MLRYIPLILTAVLLNAAAQLFLKKGMMGIGHFAFAAENAVRVSLTAASNPFIAAGLACYAVSVVLWMLALSRVEVSFAYPFLSVGYIVTAVIGYLAFHENLSPSRIFGILLICVGVTLIARSGGSISS